MARFNYSGVAITGGSGRLNSPLGGTVLLKNGVVRNYITPVNPQTGAQSEFRALFNFLNASWAGLSAANKNAWEVARKSGDWQKTDPFTGTSRPYSSAKALYIGLNTVCAIASNSVVPPTQTLAAPVSKVTPSDTNFVGFTATASTGVVSLEYGGGGLGTNEAVVMRIGPPQSPGFLKIRSNLLRTFTASAGASPIAYTSEYASTFGAITGLAGKKVFYEMWIYDDATGQSRLVYSGSTLIA